MPTAAASSPAVVAPSGTLPNTKIRDAAVTRPSRSGGTKVPRDVIVITPAIVSPARPPPAPAAPRPRRPPPPPRGRRPPPGSTQS